MTTAGVPTEAPVEVPLCRRGRHRLTAENSGTKHRCRACHAEYNRALRRGLTWDGPPIGRLACRTRRHPMSPERLRRDRAAVGACLDCGWTSDAGPHRCPEEGNPA